jgi:CHAT domain-containing protein
MWAWRIPGTTNSPSAQPHDCPISTEDGNGALRDSKSGMSMARAFLEQGAQCVVCSEWSIDDTATAELIQQFFGDVHMQRAAGQTVDCAAAVTAAKKKLRHDPRFNRGRERPGPSYWSPLVLVGA